MFLMVKFGFRNEIYGLDSVIYGNAWSYTAGISYVRHIRLLREFVLPRQHTSLPMDRIYPYLYSGYIYLNAQPCFFRQLLREFDLVPQHPPLLYELFRRDTSAK